MRGGATGHGDRGPAALHTQGGTTADAHLKDLNGEEDLERRDS